MKVYNQDKTEILTNYDLTKGYLINDKILKEIIPKKEYIEEKGHYEITKEYDNGGKDVTWVVDVKGQNAEDEKEIYEDIQIYIPFTLSELAQSEIDELKLWFDNTYTYQEQKYRRLIALNKLDDDGIDAQTKLVVLYEEAEQKRARIQELEQLF